MNWGQAKKLLRLAANRRVAPVQGATTAEAGALVARAREPSSDEPDAPRVEPARNGHPPDAGRRAVSLCVASGKGGTGKSVVTGSLASLLALRGRTLIVDADMGVGNAHILQGVSPEHSFVDVAEGRLSVGEIVSSCSANLDLLSAGSGVSRMAGLSSYEMHLIACGLEKLEERYDFLLVDSAAGISDQTISFAAACDCTLVVTTPDLTAMTDAYAFLKVLYAKNPRAGVFLVVNRVETSDEGQRAAERICNVSDRFLGRGPTWLGSLPDDPAVRHAGNHRSPVVSSAPHAGVSKQLRRLCVRILAELGRHAAEGNEAVPLGMGQRLVADCGYSSKFASR